MEKRKDTSNFDDEKATSNVDKDKEPDEDNVPDFVVTIFRTGAGQNKVVTVARCGQNQKAAGEPRTLLLISREGTDAAIHEQIVAHGKPIPMVLNPDGELAVVENQLEADEPPNANVSALEEKDEEKKKKDKKNRCAECGKRVGLTAIVCRCEKIFCAFHRYSDRHNCNFDYRQMGVKEISKDNPVVTAEKIQKI